MKVLGVASHRMQEIEAREWVTWDRKLAIGWQWTPTAEFRANRPWVPVSVGFKTLDEAEQAIDHFLDNDETLAHNHRVTQEATAAWCERYGAH